MTPFAVSAQTDPADWDGVIAAADGQTVYWHAWGGSTQTNDFIAWVGERVAADYGVVLEHVKLTDTADAVTRVLSEKQAGEDDDSAVDMIWINGANFAAMKDADLLFGPYAEQLPNWAVVDVDGKTVQTDFTVPTDGYESPVGNGPSGFLIMTRPTSLHLWAQCKRSLIGPHLTLVVLHTRSRQIFWVQLS